MWDKFGRYVHIREEFDMRVFYTDRSFFVIMSNEYPIYLAIEIIEKNYK